MKILIVDDSKAARSLVRRAFSQAGFTGCSFCEASDGDQAFVVAMTEKPDLILSDYNMPNVTGLQLVQTLRSSGVATPIGIITSMSTDEHRRQVMQAAPLHCQMG